MNYKGYIFMYNIRILLIFTLLFACKNEDQRAYRKGSEVQEINIDLKSARECKLSEITDELRYVKLKTPDEVMGEGLFKILEKHIYFWDFEQKKIYVFDHSGNLVAKLDKQGNGPGEYLFIGYFFVSNDEKSIEIWDISAQKIIRYENLTFRLLNETEVEDLVNFTSGIRLKSGDYILSTNQARNNYKESETNSEFFLYDSAGRLKNSFFDIKFKDENTKNYIQYTLFTFRLVENETDDVFTTVNFDNNIYQWKDSQFEPIQRVNFIGGKSTPNDELKKMSKNEQRLYFSNSSSFLQTASFPNLVIYNPQLEVINYRYRESMDEPMKLRHFIHFKKENRNIHAKTIVNDISAFPETIRISHFNEYGSHCDPWFKNALVAVVTPAEELKFGQVINLEPIGKIRAEDNPILVFMKLKK